MAHEHYPELFSRFDHTSQNKRVLAARASRIIAVSEHTKSEIITLLGIKGSMIDVIPHAATLSAPGLKHPNILLPDEYILYVGKRNTYKNFPTLLQALHSIRSSGRISSLICAGGGLLTKHELTEIERLNLKEAVSQMNANDDLLAYLYSKAKAFVYPSLYEGFGIPVLEAFACGCPAILSNRTSLPEVGGNAARYFDPEDVGSLVSSLLEVLKNKDLAEDMKKNGIERAKLFSWKKTAKQTLETYHKVVG
jgi:glycosyltransferase involved in cell wall biosynthesis